MAVSWLMPTANTVADAMAWNVVQASIKAGSSVEDFMFPAHLRGLLDQGHKLPSESDSMVGLGIEGSIRKKKEQGRTPRPACSWVHLDQISSNLTVGQPEVVS
ncbi:hypothetical protein L1987_34573 [Smallanthus sonchifolius]|uniref:Uncharacterized protein n=1 Tax=Smallanthus sonchifolius TaxID=185202 RepID=A0ACB9HVW8_9ASTR|nr:hypothetical protein L1987_34573 [Smallanthus sonchifolius]